MTMNYMLPGLSVISAYLYEKASTTTANGMLLPLCIVPGKNRVKRLCSYRQVLSASGRRGQPDQADQTANSLPPGSLKWKRRPPGKA